MKKYLALFLGAVLLVSLMTGCAPTEEKEVTTTPSAEPSDNVPEIEPVTLIANSTANPGTAEVIALETFKEKIEEATNGLITVEIYDSGTLFTANTETTALSSGEIDMCLTSFDWFAESGSPWVSMFNCPYMFTSYENAYEILSGEIGQEVFEQIFAEQQTKVLAPAYIGTRQLILRQDENVQTTADMAGKLLRVPTTATYVAMAEAMGAVATPMALDEVYLALQTGAIDAIEVPMSVMNSRSFYEVCKTLVMTNHLVNMKMIVMNGETWNSFDENTQSLIMEAAKAAGLACDSTVLSSEATLLEEFKEKGLNVIEPDVAEFQNTVLTAFLNNKDIVGSWDMDMYNKIVG